MSIANDYDESIVWGVNRPISELTSSVLESHLPV